MMQQHPRLFAGLLLGSLLLNLFLGGLLMGLYWQNETATSTASTNGLIPNPPLRPIQWMQAAHPATQEKIEPVFARHLQALQQEVNRLHSLHKDIRQDLSAENLDVNALSKRLEASRQAQVDIQTRMHKAFLEALSQLSVEERKNLAHSQNANLKQPQNQQNIRNHDTDGDGKISREEFLQAVPTQNRTKAEHRFQQLDVDKDDTLTKQEWQQR